MNKKIKENFIKYFEDAGSINLNMSELNKHELKFIEKHFMDIGHIGNKKSVKLTLSDSYEFVALCYSFSLQNTHYDAFKKIVKNVNPLKNKLK